MTSHYLNQYWLRSMIVLWHPWWRHQMETFSALLAICAGNSPVPGEFPTQRPVTWSFDIFFDLRLNKRLSKQSWGWWLETPSRPLRRHRNDCATVTCMKHGWFSTNNTSLTNGDYFQHHRQSETQQITTKKTYPCRLTCFSNMASHWLETALPTNQK